MKLTKKKYKEAVEYVRNNPENAVEQLVKIDDIIIKLLKEAKK